MMKKLYVTIDTEMDADSKWIKRYPSEFSSILCGIPNYLRPIWDALDVHPIYFLSPEVVENDECCEVLKQEIQKGAIIGAHLHPEYIDPEKLTEARWGMEPEKFPCSGYSYESEKLKIQNLTELIERKLGIRPVWYRAARFGTDIDTINILRELGYRHDSSVTPCIDWSRKGGPNHSLGKISPYDISDNDLYKSREHNDIKPIITEHPITILGRRFGILGRFLPENWMMYRWVRPSHMTYIEQRKLLNECKEQNLSELVMMFHSMEIMVNKTPYVRNTWMQKYYLWRLFKTLKFAKKLGYEL